ncbi:hypothetical protein ACN4EG_21380 [Alkalinema pantanalense CENA528]|uniref:hypothetical protein n=1 Tax=Alkalinema pantanalense TaxID=1620705 RepID=UPI003D6DDD57
MDFDQIPLDQLDQLPLYYIPQDPPYLLLVCGLLASLVSGLAFQAVLKQDLADWKANRQTRSITSLQSVNLLMPFLGMAIGASFFLSAGVEIFGFPPKLAYAIAVPMAFFIGWLVWRQLGSILRQIEEGGSAAIDLDSIR